MGVACQGRDKKGKFTKKNPGESVPGKDFMKKSFLRNYMGIIRLRFWVEMLYIFPKFAQVR